MYKAFFGLSKNPFKLTPDPEMVFFSANHAEVVAALFYAILSSKGFVVLTGDAGLGKTTVLTRVLQGLPAHRIQPSIISHPTLTCDEFLEMALYGFGISPVPASKAQRLQMLQRFLMQNHQQGKISALIVDEAHQLSPEVLEEIRLLGNFDFQDTKLLQIAMLGQNELDERLNRYDLRQFKQRVAIHLSLHPLGAAEVERYILFRWTKAGGRPVLPFTREALDAIVRVSHGIPRMINTICDNALMLAFANGESQRIDSHHIREVCVDLKLEYVPKPVAQNGAAIPVVVPAAPVVAAPAAPIAMPVAAVAMPVAAMPAPAAAMPAPSPAPNLSIPPNPSTLTSLRIFEQYTARPKPSLLSRWAGKLGLASQGNS